MIAEDRARVKKALDERARAGVEREEIKKRAAHEAYVSAARERHRARVEKAARDRARTVVASEGEITAKCEECSSEFTTARWWKRFCSAKCRWRAKDRRKQDVRAATL
jgi:hypothetical protein